MWHDKHFYPGTIKSAKAEGMDKYEIRFDDGDVCLVRESDMIVCELVTVGQDVLAERRSTEGHEPGVVFGHYKRDDDFGYVVEFTDMKRERLVSYRGENSLRFLKYFPKKSTINIISGGSKIAQRKKYFVFHI